MKVLIRRGKGKPTINDLSNWQLGFDYDSKDLYIRKNDEIVKLTNNLEIPVFQEEEPTRVTVGGLPEGSYIKGLTSLEILYKILYPNRGPKVKITTEGQTFDEDKPLSNVTVSADIVKGDLSVDRVEIKSSDDVIKVITDIPNGGSIDFIVDSITEAKTFTVVAYDTEGNNSSDSIEFNIHLHDVDSRIAKEPTCTEEGVREYFCISDNKIIKTESIPALGHTESIRVVKEATCEEEGLLEHYCTVCGEVLRTEPIEKVSHDEEIRVTDATCTENGKIETICKSDGRVLKTEIIPATGHSQGELVVVREPTCTVPGLKEAYCTTCGYTVASEDIPALEHDQGEFVTVKEPTCTESGLKEAYCTRCNETLASEEIPATGHTESTRVAKEPTCEEEGTLEHYCTVCGEVLLTEPIAKLEHDEEEVVTDATCTEDGKIEIVCKNDGHVLSSTVIPALGHLSDEGAVTKEPTCTEAGEKTYTCTRCGEVLEVVPIPALGHTEGEGIVTKEPTCTEPGVTTYTCSVCDEVLKTEAIPALGHDWDDGIVTVEPTEEAEGVTTYTCFRCGATKTEPIPMLTHTHTISEEWSHDDTGHWHEASCGIESHREDYAEHSGEIITVDPTCTEDGSYTQTCEVCGAVMSSGTIPALGHTWNEGVVTTEATCTEPGIKTYTCTREGCGATKTEEILAIGHIFSTVWSSDETTHWHKALCGHDVKALEAEHTWNNGVVTAEPTEEAEGEKTYTCTVCGRTKTEVIEKLEASTFTAYLERTNAVTGDLIYSKAYEVSLDENNSFSIIPETWTRAEDGLKPGKKEYYWIKYPSSFGELVSVKEPLSGDPDCNQLTEVDGLWELSDIEIDGVPYKSLWCTQRSAGGSADDTKFVLSFSR